MMCSAFTFDFNLYVRSRLNTCKADGVSQDYLDLDQTTQTTGQQSILPCCKLCTYGTTTVVSEE